MTLPLLLERAEPLAELLGALERAERGAGSTALVSGEAGIGKTALVRAFAAEAAPRARLLTAACDDLATPRTLGPLRDVFDASLDGDGMFGAVLDELARERPTVLVVEDAHWADDATLDVLGYAARRVGGLSALLVLTAREEAPLQRLLGMLVNEPLQRLELAPLSRAAVAELAAGTGRDAAAVHALTRGNPFFVAEALSAPPEQIPASVKDAVLARVLQVSAECRDVVERLSVVPSGVSDVLLGALVGDRLDTLAEAERAGLIEARPGGIGFRHELARRAIEASLPAIRRRILNAAVVTALAGSGEPARVMHHAREAGDIETLLAVGPAAAREAARAGAHRQALAHFEAVIEHAARLPDGERADVLCDYGWELHNAHRFGPAVEAAQAAIALYERLGDTLALGQCHVRLSRLLFLSGATDAAEAAAERSVQLLAGSDDLAYATLYFGAILALTEQAAEAMPVLERADRLAQACARPDLAALCLNYLAIARVEAGDLGGLETMRDSIALALAGGHSEPTARGYTNLAELLMRVGRLDELERCVEDGLRFTRERGFWSHAYNLEVHRCLLLLRRGDWDGASYGLRALLDEVPEPGILFAYSAPWLGRVLARRGDPAAGPLLADAWERAQRQRGLIGLAYAGLARAEWAWLTADRDAASQVASVLLGRTEHPGAAPWRGELLRYLARAGLAVEPFPGCPPAWAAGLAGEWRAAAAAWRRAGDPYEAALELAFSGEPDAIAEAVETLDRLGAVPAAELARDALRELGARVPRGPNTATRANPAGLTERQLAVLRLLRAGRTNAQIASELVVSIRTVDHHVAAVLSKLGVRSRREVDSAAVSLGF